ncbi:hypothetical protein [Exiguobacterium oxidotolerans]|uniref:Lipoprotein n=1 Tax=Exiguobacterium oxidotolerans TaxID=223958 RepID=A0A653IHF4_9BACL|nr:hypothetical protein [Exiguobacterium oxidotolerans]VWX38663.1 conserved exported hypothetical protein [Exiguobacterium oxidotolerans]
MKKRLFACLVTVTALAGCGADQTEEMKSPKYDGDRLQVAVVGKQPTVREDNVRFTSVSLQELTPTARISSEFDAVFIMKDHLKEADQEQYVRVYKNLRIPTFFIGSTKGYLPFVMKELTYEAAGDNAQSYAFGYLHGKKELSWEYGLYNDINTDAHITALYSDVFRTIDSVKNDRQR